MTYLIASILLALCTLGCGLAQPELGPPTNETNTVLTQETTVASRGDLYIDGLIRHEKKRLDSVHVQLLDWKTGKEISALVTDSTAKFAFSLAFDKQYKVLMSRRGFYHKYMYINTQNVPEAAKAFGFEIGGFVISMLPKSNPLRNSRLLQQPIAKIYYDTSQQGFDFDKEWSEQMQEAYDAATR